MLQLRPEFRSIELNVEAAEKQRQADALALGPHAVGVRKRAPFNYDNFAATITRGRSACSSTG